MFLSERVKESRYRLVREKMAEKGLDAFVARGSSAVRGDGAAFRYLTDFPNINIQLVLIFFRDEAKPPVLLVESRFQAMRAKKFSWIPDIRLSNRFLDSLIEVLREKGMDRATVGVDGLDRLPYLWVERIEETFPQMKIVEFGPELKKLRATVDGDETKLVKKSAALVDRAFTEGVKRIKPGKTEWEIMAYIDFLLKSEGVEKSFNIISQGPKVDAYPASSRKLSKKGMIFVEITANYGGYWTQLARAVSLGKPDKDLVKLHEVSVGAIKRALKTLKPGYKVAHPMSEMEAYVRGAGLDCTPVYGHIVGIDMVEDRPTPQNQTDIVPGMIFIVHPWPLLGESSLLWGETYLTTANGNQRLNKVGDELIVL
ncbi:MAG TPA: Xaa-Pro peptidase family protein [Candidatus Binatia bacterium]|nr:Xaa-Pro peptidase family protein [Candidatus Binatia bacterium]